jgi:hypothetical protein
VPTPDDRSHDVDDTPFDEDVSSRQEFEDSGDILFGDQDPGARAVAADRVFPGDLGSAPGTAPRRFESIDGIDAALFGQAAPSAPAAPAVEAFVAQAHRTAPAQLPGIPEEGEPAWIEDGEPGWIEDAEPAWIEEAEPGFLTEESSSEHGASRAGGNKRGRRRALVAAGFITLAVIVGAGLGAMALNRSDDPRRNADTGSESTTTTASTTTVATTPAAPETSAPPTTTTPRPAPTTGARSVRPPAPTPEEPPPAPAPAPTPAPTPPPPPPPPPPTTAVEHSTAGDLSG